MARNHKGRMARQATRTLDQQLASIRIPERPRHGWVAAVRQSLGMSQTQLARRLGVTRQGVDDMEKNEVAYKTRLATLQRAAGALDCELRYVLVPHRPLTDMVTAQSLRKARQKFERINQSQALEASAMTAEAVSGAVTDLARELELQRPADLWDD